MLTLVSFVFVLGVLIFFHELGHFAVAKKVGIRVDRFSIGFPPYIWSRQKGETIYSIGLIPLGGFVKMAGENPDEEPTGNPREFMSKTVGQRAAVIFAGPFMNYILAMVVLIGVYMFAGLPQTDPDRILVGKVMEESPAEQAGLLADDQIVQVNQHDVVSFDSMRTIISAIVQKPVEVVLKRGDSLITTSIVTRIGEVPNINGGVDTVGEIGIQEKIIGYQRYGFFEAVENGFIRTHQIVGITFMIVKKLVFGEMSVKGLGGPLFIAQQSGKEAQRGAAYFFSFMALLSVNLAVLNILPVPILDGGHLLFLAIEKIKGSPLSMKTRLVAQQVGMVALFALILLVTYNDIFRIIRGL